MYIIALIVMVYSIIHAINKFVHMFNKHDSPMKQFDNLTEGFISVLLFLFFFNYMVYYRLNKNKLNGGN